MVMLTYMPARADHMGNLNRDQTFTITGQNLSGDAVALTVYYLDSRGVERAEFMEIPAAAVFAYKF